MTYTEDRHNQAKSDMLGEFNKAILDAEDLHKVATEFTDVTPAAARESLVEKPGTAGSGPADASRAAVGAEANTADAAGDCVRDIP
jgi:hypothetical protein